MAQDDINGGKNSLTGGQLVVHALLGESVDTIFGISGSHVLAIYDALRDTPQIRSVTAGHENNAALMAEAYGRLTGKPGVVIVTAGPGATNAVSGIAQAYTVASPVVIITGSVPLNAKREIFHGVDDPTFLGRIYSAVTKRSMRVERPEDIPNALARAFSLALSGRPGPVHVEIDEHVLKATVENAPEYARIPLQKIELDAATMDQIVASLRNARHPVIVAGKGVLASFAKEELAKTAEILAAPVVFPLHATDSIGFRNRWCVGTLATMMGPNHYAIKAMREADLLLGIGLRPESADLEIILRNAPGNFIFIGFDDEQIPQSGVAISCVAEIKGTLRALIERLEPHRRTPDQALLAEIESDKQTVLKTFQAAMEPYRHKAPVHFGLALEELVKHLTPDSIVVGDVGNHSVWSQAYLTRLGVEGYFVVGSWGAMGYAIPGSIGAKVACPERQVVGITGDGSFLMASADFATAVQNRLHVVYVILKDNCFGMVEKLQKRDYGRSYAVEIQSPDFVKYAESFGALGIRVEHPSVLGEAFQRAFMADGPVVVEVVSDTAVPYVPIPAPTP